jgi:putative hydrolase of the HAD superfamily
MPIKCVTFDLDDTLWAIQPVIARAEKHFYEWLENNTPRIPDAFTLEDLTSNRHAFFKNRPELHHDLSQLRKHWITGILEQFEYSTEKLDEGFSIFWKHRNSVELFDNALDALEYTNNNYFTGAITNGNADIHHIGIGSYFNFYLTSAEVGNSKPHPAIFEAAITRSECTPEQIIHVGDDPERDVAGAARMGLKTVWVNTSNQVWEGDVLPDAEIQNIGELPEVLRRWPV